MTDLISTKRVFQHLIANFSLYGFGSEQGALLQTLKELSDNSWDAISHFDKSSAGKGLIKIICSSSFENPDQLIIEVQDSGSGMLNPGEFLNCFATSKGSGTTSLTPPDDVKKIGKYGVGLTCVFLYSVLQGGKSMRVISIPQEDPARTVIADFTVDAVSFEISTREIMQVNTTGSNSCGTIIRISFPVSTYDYFPAIVKSFDDHLRRFNWLPSITSIHFEVRTPTFNFKSVHDGVSTAAVIGAQRNESIYKAHLLNALQSILSADQQCTIGHVVEERREALSVVVALALVTSDDSLIITAPDSETKQLVSNLDLSVFRFVNGTPLLDRGDDALSCAITVAVRSFNWRRFGHKFAVDPLSAESRKQVVRSPAYHLETINDWQEFRDDDESSNPRSLVIVINLSQSQVSFGSSQKTSVEHNEAVIEVITRGLQRAMTSLAEKTSTFGLFRSVSTRQKVEISTKNIPTVANALAKLMTCCSKVDVAFASDCEAVVGLNPLVVSEEHAASALLARMEDVYASLCTSKRVVNDSRKQAGKGDEPDGSVGEYDDDGDDDDDIPDDRVLVGGHCVGEDCAEIGW